ncbi:MAG: hypothetical protein WC717_06360 [Candidatus Micrarchaeia archaeon]
MEKMNMMAFASVLVLLVGMLFAASGASGSAGEAAGACAVFPSLSLGEEKVSVAAGRVAIVSVAVSGAQPGGCGAQQYGVDFTNGYDGKEFVLALNGMQERNLFFLLPGKGQSFEGLIGVPPGTPAGNYTVQVTAYAESDHWKQVSKTLQVEVKPLVGSDAYWKTNLQVGWNLVPYAQGMGIYGCDAIITGYRYSPFRGDYIQMDRFGPLFTPAPFEPSVEDEKFGAMFVFSRERCAMESRLPSEALSSPVVSITGGQLLSIPPAWHGQQAGAIAEACAKQSGASASQVQIRQWDASRQEWAVPSQGDALSNGGVLRIVPSGSCSLDLSQKVA